jgi:hypothetical protein
LAPGDFNEIQAEHPSPLPPTYTLSKEIEGITREIAVLIGYLLKGLFVSFGRKVRDEGIPRAIQFSYWLRKQSVILARKLIEVGTPKAIEAISTVHVRKKRRLLLLFTTFRYYHEFETLSLRLG